MRYFKRHALYEDLKFLDYFKQAMKFKTLPASLRPEDSILLIDFLPTVPTFFFQDSDVFLQTYTKMKIGVTDVWQDSGFSLSQPELFDFRESFLQRYSNGLEDGKTREGVVHCSFKDGAIEMVLYWDGGIDLSMKSVYKKL